MLYQGRHLDAVAFWEKYVNFPHRMPEAGFAPLVHCPNPDHPTDKKHFQVNLDQPLVHCFAGCGISGTYEHAVALIEGISEARARRNILKHTGVKAGTSSQRKRGSARTRKRDSGSDDKGVARIALEFERRIPGLGLDYLAERGIDPDSVARFKLGWDSSERRIVIPACDSHGSIRFLIKRAVLKQDWPKYLYTEGVERDSLLFGACHWRADEVRSEGVVLCEGSLDCIKLHQNGVTNAGAVLGTYLSERQASIIASHRPKRVITMFDRDAAGWRAIQRVERYLPKCPIFVTLYPQGKSDPAELSRGEVQHVIDKALPLAMFRKRLPERITRGDRSGKSSYAASRSLR